MRPHGIIIPPPCFEDAACFVKRAEPVLVQAFVAQFAVQALGEAILLRLARCDVMPIDARAVGWVATEIDEWIQQRVEKRGEK